MNTGRSRTTSARAVAVIACGLGTIMFGAAATASAAASDPRLAVHSTLGDRAVLPQRISWRGIPTLTPSKVRRVDFLIDGRLVWTEQRPPYSYGGDGNYLVTSWLNPGTHRFTVETVTTDRRRASTSTVARVAAAPRPPAGLAGTWERLVAPEEVRGAIDSPPGRWRLTIDEVGWRFRQPGGHGAVVDVVYLNPSLLEARGGIYSQPDIRGQEGNLWCDVPFAPVRYRWAVAGDTLTLTLAGPKRCDGQSDVWAASWSRVSRSG